MRFALLSLLTGLIYINGVFADERADLKGLLSHEIIGPNQALDEVQKFAASRVPPLPAVKSVAEWEQHAERIRRETLERAVYQGEAAAWRDAKTTVVWMDTISGGPGYRIKKLRYEALPGLWIPALLYEPEHLAGKLPVFLNVNGHDAKGKAADYKQIRCINQAKRGILALNVEWLGMGQLRSEFYTHYKMNQLDLCGTSGLAPFYLAMKRGLDVLLSLEHADSTRVGVAGLSGGGWQTIVISSLDTRVTFANPVAGYSSFITRGKNFSDLGDSEQTPVDLATVADYSHLTALMAPRPTLLTYNLNDNCCFKADHALPPLLEAASPIYALYGKEKNLRHHVNAVPGNHNFELDNREAHYRMLGAHFFSGDKSFNAEEIPSGTEVKTAEELYVEFPNPNANFHSLAMALAAELPRNAELPAEASAASKWQVENRAKLAQIVKAKGYTVQAEAIGDEIKSGVKATFWKLKLAGDWTIPAVELVRGEAEATAIVVADAGRVGAIETIETLLSAKRRIIAVDPFYFGESKIGQRDHLFALLVSTVGERPLGIQASQLAAVARWSEAQHQRGPVTIVAVGPRTSLITLVAAGLEDDAIAGVELHGTLGSLKETIEQNRGVNEAPELFTFGLLESFDIKQLVALVAPRPVIMPSASDRVKRELAGLKEWYQLLGNKFALEK